jgi:hypothetical protein
MTDPGAGSDDLPFDTENDTERRIVTDDKWRRGAAWGVPRPGHPEGAVVHHVAEVLANVDRYRASDDERPWMRLIALTHDSFKHLVDRSKPRVGENHHGMIARRFTERYSDDHEVLEIIELHDEAFNAYAMGARNAGRWGEAEQRANRLVERLGAALPMYRRFYRCDNETGSKSPESLAWFEGYCSDGGL